MTSQAGDRYTLYTALAGLLAPPTKEMLELVGCSSFVEPVAAAVMAVSDGQSDVESAVDAVSSLSRLAATTPLGDLEIEHARLFAGPGTPVAPPWESAWITQEKEEMGVVPVAVVESVAAAYIQGACRLNRSPEPADFLETELEFLSFLSEEAAASGPGSSAEALHDAFLREHFSGWAPRLAETVQREARQPFYTAVARLLSLVAA